MLVRYLCYYSTDISCGRLDCGSNEVVKCLKDSEFSGTGSIRVGDVDLQLDKTNKQGFLAQLWATIGQSLQRVLPSQGAIIPIPDSAGMLGGPSSYRTLRYAQAIAANSSGKLIAVDGLRWKADMDPRYKHDGRRGPVIRYDSLVVIESPTLPIVLFDDTITSGSAFVAAQRRLSETGNEPQRGYVIGRRCKSAEQLLLINEERELELSWGPEGTQIN